MSERILVHELEIPIRWGDMDAMGHVNNTVYFRYMEQIRIAWLEALGFKPEPANEGPLIINASCTFLRELRYPGTVTCRLYTGAAGRSTIETYTDMYDRSDSDEPCATGAARIVWVDHRRKKSAPLPDHARDAMMRAWRS